MDPQPMRNPTIQCLNPGCGTHLLPDGTCPRCSPVLMRPSDEKLEIGRAWGDERVIAVAQRELGAQAQATAVSNPSAFRRAPTDDEIEAEVQRRVAEQLTATSTTSPDGGRRGRDDKHDKHK